MSVTPVVPLAATFGTPLGWFWFSGVLAGLFTVPFVLLSTKTAQAKLGWLLALFSLPWFGFVLYWGLGRSWLKRRVLRLRHSRIAQRLDVTHIRATALRSVRRAVGLAEEVVRAASQEGAEAPYPGNTFLALAEGPTAAKAAKEALEAARDHIHLQTYIFKSDRTGNGVRDLLVAAARRGVKVRVLFDALGTYRTSRRFFHPIVEAGGQVAAFLPLGKGLRNLRMNLRNHRKILVVDGGTAFTGGMNIADEYATADGWRDVHARIRGPACVGLQRVFVEDWHFATGELLDDERWFRGADPVGEVPIQVVTSGPDQDVPMMESMFFAAIAGARKSVDLMSPYFVPSEPLEAALADAARRGRRVRVLVPGVADHVLTGLIASVMLPRVMLQGVEVWQYPKMMHGKVLVVDDAWATVGSANFDNRSLRLNFELNLAFPHAATAVGLRELFEAQLKVSRRMSPEDFRTGVFGNLVRHAAALFAPIL